MNTNEFKEKTDQILTEDKLEMVSGGVYTDREFYTQYHCLDCHSDFSVPSSVGEIPPIKCLKCGSENVGEVNVLLP